MRFDAQVNLVNGAAAADPVTNPGDVLPSHLANLPTRPSAAADVITSRLLLALLAPAAEGVTADLWALVEVQRPDEQSPSARVFVRFATAVALTGGSVVAVTGPVPPGGVVYVRRTADTLTVPRSIGVACAA